MDDQTREVLPATAILGLGLIGGSLARCIAAAGVHVIAHDADPRSLEAALSEGVVQVGLGTDLEGLEEAGIVVLAVPVSAAPALLEKALPRLRNARLVTDVGSTKRNIVAAAERLGIGSRFVGSHPFAGSHRSGWRSARKNLFVKARVFLCPARGAVAESLSLAQALWKAAGARPEIVDAQDHDAQLAWTSHLPQALSTALGLALADHGVARADLGRGGRGLTRLVDSSPAMWCGIMMENRDEILPALSAVKARLADLEIGLERNDEAAIGTLFAAGQDWFRQGRRGKR